MYQLWYVPLLLACYLTLGKFVCKTLFSSIEVEIIVLSPLIFKDHSKDKNEIIGKMKCSTVKFKKPMV
jgi:hypothetical protein